MGFSHRWQSFAISSGCVRLLFIRIAARTRGGSTIGLAFGVIGFGFMMFARYLGRGSAFRRGAWAARKPGCAATSGSAFSPCQ